MTILDVRHATVYAISYKNSLMAKIWPSKFLKPLLTTIFVGSNVLVGVAQNKGKFAYWQVSNLDFESFSNGKLSLRQLLAKSNYYWTSSSFDFTRTRYVQSLDEESYPKEEMSLLPAKPVYSGPIDYWL